jgi:hypothetical protein
MVVGLLIFQLNYLGFPATWTVLTRERGNACVAHCYWMLCPVTSIICTNLFKLYTFTSLISSALWSHNACPTADFAHFICGVYYSLKWAKIPIQRMHRRQCLLKYGCTARVVCTAGAVCCSHSCQHNFQLRRTDVCTLSKTPVSLDAPDKHSLLLAVIHPVVGTLWNTPKSSGVPTAKNLEHEGQGIVQANWVGLHAQSKHCIACRVTPTLTSLHGRGTWPICFGNFDTRCFCAYNNAQ